MPIVCATAAHCLFSSERSCRQLLHQNPELPAKVYLWTVSAQRFLWAVCNPASSKEACPAAVYLWMVPAHREAWKALAAEKKGRGLYLAFADVICNDSQYLLDDVIRSLPEVCWCTEQ